LIKFEHILKMIPHFIPKQQFFVIGVTIGKNVQLKKGRIPTYRII